MKLERCIPMQTERHLGYLEPVQQLLRMVEEDPKQLTERIQNLHFAHLKLMERMGPDTDGAEFPNVLQVQKLLIENETQLATRSPFNLYVSGSVPRSAERTFKYIEQHIGDEWSFVTKMPDINRLFSTMLLKGFARFLEIDAYAPELSGPYEAAMLEVLQHDLPDSLLARDLQVTTSAASSTGN